MLPETKTQRVERLRTELRNAIDNREASQRTYFRLLDKMEKLFEKSAEVRLFVALTQAKDNRTKSNSHHDSMIAVIAQQLLSAEDQVNDEPGE